MSRFTMQTFLRLGQRSYAAATAEASSAPAGTAAVRRPAESGDAAKETFWMRDPKTGNWIPENRFNDIDEAELRAQIMNHKKEAQT